MPNIREIIAKWRRRPSPEDSSEPPAIKKPNNRINTLEILKRPVQVFLTSASYQLAPESLFTKANTATIVGKTVTAVNKVFPPRQEIGWSAFLLPEAKRVELAAEIEQIISKPLKGNGEIPEGKISLLIDGHPGAAKQPWPKIINNRVGETELVLDFIPPLIASALKQAIENGGKVGIATMSKNAPSLIQIATITLRTISVLQKEPSLQRAAQCIFAKSRQVEVLQITPAQNKAITFNPIQLPAPISPGKPFWGEETIRRIATIPDKVPFTSDPSEGREPILLPTKYDFHPLKMTLPTQYHHLTFRGSTRIKPDPVNFFPRAFPEGEGPNARLRLVLPEWDVVLSGVDLASGAIPPDLQSRISNIMVWVGPAAIGPFATEIETIISQNTSIQGNQLFTLVEEAAKSIDLSSLLEGDATVKSALALLDVAAIIKTNPDMTPESAKMVREVATANALRAKGTDKDNNPPPIMVSLE